MKFILYGYTVSLMPGGAQRYFLAKQFSNIWQHFWQKINVLKILSPESVRLIGSEILQNIPELLAKL